MIRRLQPFIAAACVVLAFAGATAAGMLDAPERASLVGRLRLRGPLAPPPDVAIIAIDEASLVRYGQMPWDRRRFAALLDRLHADGAKAVGIDVAFNEAAREPAEDVALAQAIAKMGRVVLPAYSLAGGAEGRTVLFEPLPSLQAAAAALGLAQFTTADEIHELDPMRREGDTMLPTFGLAVARAAGLSVASSAEGYLNPMGPAGHFPRTSFHEALQAPPGAFRDKIVMVGATAQGLPDTGFMGPFMERGRMSGIELHATALANLSATGPLRRQPLPLTLIVLLVLGLGPGAYLASEHPAPSGRRVLVLIALLILLTGAAQGALLRGWWLDLVPAAGVVITCFVAGLAAQQARLLRDRNRMLEWYAADLAREARRERERIDGELHDETQQLLIALTRDLRRVRKLLSNDAAAAGERLDGAEGLAKRILEEVMRVRKALVPHTLARSGLRVAVEEMVADYAARSRGLAVEAEIGSWRPLEPGREAELYWLVKEALNNALKHAAASHIRLALRNEGQEAVVTVEDDGKGFVVPELEHAPEGPEHSGLHRMWVRVQALRGHLAVASAPGKGTRIEMRFPQTGGAR
ncbi:CHASE2 domain-containing protein [bacterium]|nr:CHASE2 domain-containing protein [bacterium]